MLSNNLTFSNPRLVAEFNDWPSGKNRVRCVFKVERNKRGFRVSRTTTGKPKYTIYGGPSCIVDGSDGKTYVLQAVATFAAVHVYQHDFMDALVRPGNGSGYIYPEQTDDYNALTTLINDSGAASMPRE